MAALSLCSRVQSASTSGSLDAVRLHRVDERPHVLGAGSHDAVRGAQARLDRLQVGPAAGRSDARDTQTQASTGPSGVSVVRVSRRRSSAASRFSRALCDGPALVVRDLEDEAPALVPRGEAEDRAGRLGRSPAPPGLVQERAAVSGQPGRTGVDSAAAPRLP